MKVSVYVTYKPEIRDPEGEALAIRLRSLGFPAVISVRKGKILEIELTDTEPAKVYVKVQEMCDKLLASSVEDWHAVYMASEDDDDAS